MNYLALHLDIERNNMLDEQKERNRKQRREGGQQMHKKGSVRHAEKRRTGTCLFADRIAKVSIQAFHDRVPADWRGKNKQVCLATIVAHFSKAVNSNVEVETKPVDDESNNSSNFKECSGQLQVLGLGVGTKFLSEEIIFSEITAATRDEAYGTRIRDLHAEILARRAFRHLLTAEMKNIVLERNAANAQSNLNVSSSFTHSSYRRILQPHTREEGDGQRFSLVDGVTLHFYTSSTPCGNSSLKKFAKMSKEKYNTSLGADEWLDEPHEDNPVPAHSLHLGNFALLVKKDYSLSNSRQQQQDNCEEVCVKIPIQADFSHIPLKQRAWPANVSDEWCPPGTTVPHLGRGSIHTCSDKICRWNMMGLQGSLLASLLDAPLYMRSLTIGRKFSRCMAQRAVCCRAIDNRASKSKRSKRKRDSAKIKDDDEIEPSKYQLNHPSIMGTGVYLDDSGIIEMSGEKTAGQDVRFLSSLCWIWSPYSGLEAECLDGDTGFIHSYQDSNTNNDLKKYSSSSTFALTTAFVDLLHSMEKEEGKVIAKDGSGKREASFKTLDQLHEFKCQISPKYEATKGAFLQKDRVFYQWNRRSASSQLQTVRL